jgi:uncharacterized membrane protein
MLRRFFFIFIAISTFFYASFGFAIQNERILDFQNNTFINNDGSIDILENIVVYANQAQIKHGIVRWLPIDYVDSYGISHHTNYEINKVQINGENVAFTEDFSNQALHIRIGDKDRDLTPGVYTFTLQYHIINAVTFLNDADELYWNITGNHWDFPIDKVTATIQLPQGAILLKQAAYTGLVGQIQQKFTSHLNNNQIIYKTTSVLQSGEGLTIAVAWPKGIVKLPTTIEKIKSGFQETSTLFLFALLLFIFMYYMLIWSWVNPDTSRRTIVPLFEPPLSLPPAAVRYIYKQCYDVKVFTAEMVSAATKGFVTIIKKDNVVTLTKTEMDLTQLPEYESIVFQRLFSKKNEIKLDPNSANSIQAAEQALATGLINEFKNKYFIKTTRYHILPWFLTLIAFFIASYRTNNIYAVGVFVGSILFYYAFQFIPQIFARFSIFTTKSKMFFEVTRIIVVLIFSMIFLVPAIGYFFQLEVNMMMVLIFFFCIGLLNMIFYYVLKAPNSAGRKVLNQIEGFKLFIKTAERYRLNQLYPADKVITSFEQFLPYAIALDVETEWAQQFTKLLTNAGIDPTAYTTNWASGMFLTTNTITSLTSALRSSSVTTSDRSVSSSASSGGGSSGGGGGGGGGSGW